MKRSHFIIIAVFAMLVAASCGGGAGGGDWGPGVWGDIADDGGNGDNPFFIPPAVDDADVDDAPPSPRPVTPRQTQPPQPDARCQGVDQIRVVAPPASCTCGQPCEYGLGITGGSGEYKWTRPVSENRPELPGGLSWRSRDFGFSGTPEAAFTGTLEGDISDKHCDEVAPTTVRFRLTVAACETPRPRVVMTYTPPPPTIIPPPPSIKYDTTVTVTLTVGGLGQDDIPVAFKMKFCNGKGAEAACRETPVKTAEFDREDEEVFTFFGYGVGDIREYLQYTTLEMQEPVGRGINNISKNRTPWLLQGIKVEYDLGSYFSDGREEHERQIVYWNPCVLKFLEPRVRARFGPDDTALCVTAYTNDIDGAERDGLVRLTLTPNSNEGLSSGIEARYGEPHFGGDPFRTFTLTWDDGYPLYLISNRISNRERGSTWSYGDYIFDADPFSADGRRRTRTAGLALDGDDRWSPGVIRLYLFHPAKSIRYASDDQTLTVGDGAFYFKEYRNSSGWVSATDPLTILSYTELDEFEELPEDFSAIGSHYGDDE